VVIKFEVGHQYGRLTVLEVTNQKMHRDALTTSAGVGAE
jgi:hypothetical protein